MMSSRLGCVNLSKVQQILREGFTACTEAHMGQVTTVPFGPSSSLLNQFLEVSQALSLLHVLGKEQFPRERALLTTFL